ncbi:MAG TPA: sigma-54 dependent transcriptional regulator [Candidatus Binatia bacterium]|nr:sigma-54 dependent transcriptional regulator [Candidatus Binatia bacterium]
MTTPLSSFAYPDPAVIVASPNAGIRKQILQNLTLSRINAAEALGGAEALGKLENSECQLLLLDRKLPDLDAEELRQIIHRRFPGIDVLLLDDAGNPALPAEWRSSSALHLFETMRRWQAPASGPAKPPAAVAPLPGMVGQASCMAAVYRMARLVAPRTTPVLITGATGTGKEVLAGAIHQLSPRAGKPFVVINCAAIPEALLESELFGYVRGAFTGAVQSRLGRVHAAHGGTLFLDEIGELPLGIQAKLLRFLDQGEVQRLGSSDLFRVDVRVIAATNANLAELARNRQFREDLYYRLSVFPIALPSLSERPGDVAALAHHFLRRFQAGNGGDGGLPSESLRLLEQHSWPGNVRELQHVLERAAILADGGTILPEHLGLPADNAGVASGQCA